MSRVAHWITAQLGGLFCPKNQIHISKNSPNQSTIPCRSYHQVRFFFPKAWRHSEKETHRVFEGESWCVLVGLTHPLTQVEAYGPFPWNWSKVSTMLAQWEAAKSFTMRPSPFQIQCEAKKLKRKIREDVSSQTKWKQTGKKPKTFEHAGIITWDPFGGSNNAHVWELFGGVQGFPLPLNRALFGLVM